LTSASQTGTAPFPGRSKEEIANHVDERILADLALGGLAMARQKVALLRPANGRSELGSTYLHFLKRFHQLAAAELAKSAIKFG
jgi:hypothetical protein